MCHCSDRATALQTLTDPNRGKRNLWSQCKGQGWSGKTHIKWLIEIIIRGHTWAGHSHTNPQPRRWPAPGHTDSPQTAKLISFPELRPVTRCGGSVEQSLPLQRGAEWDSPVSLHKDSQEHRAGRQEVIKMSYIQALLPFSDRFELSRKYRRQIQVPGEMKEICKHSKVSDKEQ